MTYRENAAPPEPPKQSWFSRVVSKEDDRGFFVFMCLMWGGIATACLSGASCAAAEGWHKAECYESIESIPEDGKLACRAQGAHMTDVDYNRNRVHCICPR